MNKLITFFNNLFTKGMILFIKDSPLIFFKTYFYYGRGELKAGLLIDSLKCNVVTEDWKWESSHVITFTFGLVFWVLSFNFYYGIEPYKNDDDIMDILDKQMI